jgi:hypothetical protein
MNAHHVLVLIEPGRAGTAAVAAARELAAAGAVELTIVGVAPQASGPRCGTSIHGYNRAVIDAVAQDLAEAAAGLRETGACVVSRMIVEGVDPPLAHLAAAGNFDAVLLPSRRSLRPRATHPAAAQVAASTPANVRIVTPRRSAAVQLEGSSAMSWTAAGPRTSTSRPTRAAQIHSSADAVA